MQLKRLKIGIFMDSYFPAIDGVVVVIDNLAKELSKFNDVTVVVPYTESVIEDKNRPYKVIRVNSIKLPKSEYRLAKQNTKFSKFYKKLKSENFDIIHIHSPFIVGRLGLKLAKDLNIPCIATMHTRFDFEIRKRVKNELIVKEVIKNLIKVYNKCDKCIAINNAMINVFKDYGYKYEPVVIYNGTDLKPLKEINKNISIINNLYNLNNNEYVFLFVGRIIDIKNIFFILDALKLLKQDGVKFKMLYVGTGADEKKLKLKINEYDMEDCVFLTGRITDRKILSSLYKRANLFLFPSLFDASSLVQIEAAVNETPGVFIEGSVTADTIINNVNGFASKNSVIEYKNRIEEIIKDKRLLNKVSKNAKKMLGKSWDKITLETYNLYVDEIEKKIKN